MPANWEARGRADGSAPLFAALGDATRLMLVSRLREQGPLSITQLSTDLPITRQAVTKHLRVMEEAGLVHSQRQGREVMWQLSHPRLLEARNYLDQISTQWDDALERLRQQVEE